MAERKHRNCTRAFSSTHLDGQLVVTQGGVDKNTLTLKQHRTPIQIAGVAVSATIRERLAGQTGFTEYRIQFSNVTGWQWASPNFLDELPEVPEIRADTAPDIGFFWRFSSEPFWNQFSDAFRPVVIDAAKSYTATQTPPNGQVADLLPGDASAVLSRYITWSLATETAVPQCPPPSEFFDSLNGLAVRLAFHPGAETGLPVPGGEYTVSAGRSGVTLSGNYGSTNNPTGSYQATAEFDISVSYWPIRTYPHLIDGYTGPTNPMGQPGPCPSPTVAALLLQRCDSGPGSILVPKAWFDDGPFSGSAVVRIGGVCYSVTAELEALGEATQTPTIEEGYEDCDPCLNGPVPCWVLRECDGTEIIIVSVSEIDRVPGAGPTILYQRKCWTRVAESNEIPGPITAEDIDARFAGCGPCQEATAYAEFGKCGQGTGPNTVYMPQAVYDALDDPPVAINLRTVAGYTPGCYGLTQTDVNGIPPDAVVIGPGVPREASCADCLQDIGDQGDPGTGPGPGGGGGPQLNAGMQPGSGNENAVAQHMASGQRRGCSECGQ